MYLKKNAEVTGGRVNAASLGDGALDATWACFNVFFFSCCTFFLKIYIYIFLDLIFFFGKKSVLSPLLRAEMCNAKQEPKKMGNGRIH